MLILIHKAIKKNWEIFIDNKLVENLRTDRSK